jgi:hypothetical protein
MEYEGKQGDDEEKEKIGNTEELEIVVWRSWYPIWSVFGGFRNLCPGFKGQCLLKYSAADTRQLHRLLYRIFFLLSNDFKIELATVYKHRHSR